MKLNFKTEQKYLSDGYGDQVWLQRLDNTYYGMTTTLGYASYGLDYVDASITKKKLSEHFEVVEDLKAISFINSKKIIFAYDELYKHKDSDSFIFVGLNLSKQTEWDDAMEDSIYKEDHFKVHKMFYKKDDKDLESILSFYNKTLTLSSDSESLVNVVLKTASGFRFKEFPLNPLPVDVEKHYNEGFKEVHEDLVDRLKVSKKGIVMLHGVAGSGKTSYIKYLTSLVPNKKFVFIPSTMIGHLSDPAFIENLIDNKNSVLILEDCEIYIQDRKMNTGNNNFVSSLLNISDGILSDVMSIQVICTFNNDLKNIDEALLRDGRLLCEYKFDRLSVGRSDNLIKELGSSLEQGKEYTLAQIFNSDKKLNRADKGSKKIGFR